MVSRTVQWSELSWRFLSQLYFLELDQKSTVGSASRVSDNLPQLRESRCLERGRLYRASGCSPRSECRIRRQRDLCRSSHSEGAWQDLNRDILPCPSRVPYRTTLPVFCGMRALVNSLEFLGGLISGALI